MHLEFSHWGACSAGSEATDSEGGAFPGSQVFDVGVCWPNDWNMNLQFHCPDTVYTEVFVVALLRYMFGGHQSLKCLNRYLYGF